jgi:hypothetical protein
MKIFANACFELWMKDGEGNVVKVVEVGSYIEALLRTPTNVLRMTET